MRRVRRSLTAINGLQMLLHQGLPKFGSTVVHAKLQRVDRTLAHLAEYPRTGIYKRRQKLYHYPVADTPFVVVDEFDDTDLRVLFIVHKSADRRLLKRAIVAW